MIGYLLLELYVDRAVLHLPYVPDAYKKLKQMSMYVSVRTKLPFAVAVPL
jgi:hypothetical protein